MTQAARPTALVTGASSGIGLELATLLARDGHDLVLVARSRGKLEDIARALHEEFAITATVVARDLADPTPPRTPSGTPALHSNRTEEWPSGLRRWS